MMYSRVLNSNKLYILKYKSRYFFLFFFDFSLIFESLFDLLILVNDFFFLEVGFSLSYRSYVGLERGFFV